MSDNKMPLSVILDMAKNEIETHVLGCMQANNIPAAFMVYVVKDVLLNLEQIKTEQLSEEFTNHCKEENNVDQHGQSDNSNAEGA